MDNVEPLQAEMNALREKLQLLQQIQQLQLQVNGGDQPRQPAQPTMRIKPPEGSYSMSCSDYRTYKKDVEIFKSLTNYADAQIILQLRLNMDMDLKRVIDANYPNWETKTLDEALGAIEHIVKETSNPAVYRKMFQETNQMRDEPFQTFYTKLRGLSVDCAFVCPFDDSHDLTDHEISNRILSGVHDETLQQEILTKHDTFNSIDELVKYCENYEVTKRDTVKLKSISSGNDSSICNIDDGLSQEEIVEAILSYKRAKNQRGGRNQNSDKCGQCGYAKHTNDGPPCVA